MSLTTGTKNDVKSSRDSSTRQTDTRDHATRQAQSSEPISGLYAPTPPPGIVYKWVRYLIGNNEDEKNVIDNEMQGWVNVKPEDIVDPRYKSLIGSNSTIRKRGRIQYGDMVLMQNDDSITAHSRREAERALQSQNNTLKSPTEMQSLGDRKYIQSTPVEHRRYSE